MKKFNEYQAEKDIMQIAVVWLVANDQDITESNVNLLMTEKNFLDRLRKAGLPLALAATPTRTSSCATPAI